MLVESNSDAVVLAGRRARALAWLYVCLHLAAHGVEEALTGFVDVWNPVLLTMQAATGIPLPQLVFDEWLTTLAVVVIALTAMTPLVARGVRGFQTGSYVLAFVMIANGVNHLASPLYLGRFLPGQYTSPLLIVASLWLIRQTYGVTRSRRGIRPALGSFMFFLAAPGTVAGWIPYAISQWQVGPAFAGLEVGRVFGGVLVAVAISALVECFARFALVGRGVPAPVLPTQTLVISGLYRYCRNPMYVCVVAAIVGQALILGSRALLLYAGAVWLLFYLFVLIYEEPTLARQFRNYREYKAHVPRWLPRRRRWSSDAALGTFQRDR